MIRLHIRANSNSAADQGVKLEVRDAVNAYLCKRLTGVDDYAEAVGIIKASLEDIEGIAQGKLNAFGYGAKAKFTNEYFPARSYEDLVVDSGYYDALIVELGSAQGDNWWCVIYPPLCYAGARQKVYYKSLIKEWLNQLFG